MHLEKGTHPVLETGDSAVGVSAETFRRLACDASVVVVTEDDGGSVLDVGRKTRTIPASIRRALRARDRRCLFPGCTARRCDAHHIEHWADGGRTALDNLILICRRHHRLVHEGGFSVERHDTAEVMFRRPDGRRVEVSPRTFWNGAPIAPRGVGAHSLRTWDGTPLRLAYAIDVLHPSANPPARTASPQAPVIAAPRLEDAAPGHCRR